MRQSQGPEETVLQHDAWFAAVSNARDIGLVDCGDEKYELLAGVGGRRAKRYVASFQLKLGNGARIREAKTGKEGRKGWGEMVRNSGFREKEERHSGSHISQYTKLTGARL